MATQPIRLAPQPGIRRDGTRLYGQQCTDGQWVRFYGNRPAKIGGYKVLSPKLGGISRGLHLAATGGITYIHSGASDRLELLRVHADGIIVDPADRTPTSLVASTDNVWTFGAIQDVIAGAWKLVAHAAPNGSSIDSDTAGTVYIGDLNDVAPLTAVMDGASEFQVSGGLCVVHPFVVYFGSAGEVIWSVSNKPGDVTTTSGAGTNIAAGDARPTGAKIVAGRALLGSGVPGALLWSLDTLVRMSYVGGAATWDFDPIASIEIIAARSVVEYNGTYYWIGAERLQAFTGQGVTDIPNDYNILWFFDHINRAQAAKIFGFAIPSRGEIWWCFPKDDATECNHALVWKVGTPVWYDTPLPNGGRSAGLSPSSTYPYPLLAGIQASGNQYRLWQHEIGVDETDGANVRAIRSYYVTSDITLLRGDQPSSASVEALDLEPDFVQTGDMTVTVIGNANARAPDQLSPPVTIPAPTGDLAPEKQLIELKEERRQMRFRFESNTLGGYFEGGESYVHIVPTGGRTRT